MSGSIRIRVASSCAILVGMSTFVSGAPALADIGPGPVEPSTDAPAVQMAWVVGVCLIALVVGLVVARLVPSVRNRTVLAAAALIVVTYPIVWAFGYQDHPWHFHLAANVLAMLATIGAAIVFSFGESTKPPVSRGWTVSALFVAVSSVGVARFWDALWQPGSDVIGGPGVVMIPLVWTGVAVVVVAVVVPFTRRRITAEPERVDA